MVNIMRCSEKARARCKYKETCGDGEYLAGSECDRFNRIVEVRTINNGDRIREMSNDELAEFIMKTAICSAKEPWCKVERLRDCENGFKCMGCILRWIEEDAAE